MKAEMERQKKRIAELEQRNAELENQPTSEGARGGTSIAAIAAIVIVNMLL